MPPFDVKELEAEIDQEVTDAAVKAAKKKLIGKRTEVQQAKQVLRNLEREYNLLLLEVTDEIG